MSDKRLLELIRTNEIEEFLSYFPEYKSEVNDLQYRVFELEQYLDTIINEKINLVEYTTRKEYAGMATKTKYPAFCFSYLDGKVSNPLDWVWSMPNDKILEQLDKLATG